ncbi:DUF2905 domain-containing protein [Pectinatus frisingensis]|jgi:Zn-dependent protease with chaperone function|uniref:DUF2905 domain-containing protein n=1 Tax=Pectinatus frisingensis TaxID=865 RepID=UPI0015F78126|nr:DUF2905 domain-containing protein [Pectinatus frisingensis]
MNDLGKLMIYAGLILIIAGLIFHFGGKFLPLGKLPGDFKWESKGFGIYFPLASSILISILLTIILNLFSKH